MLFYYVQEKDRHDAGINIREKPSVASVNKDRGSHVGGRGSALRLLAGILGGRMP